MRKGRSFKNGASYFNCPALVRRVENSAFIGYMNHVFMGYNEVDKPSTPPPPFPFVVPPHGREGMGMLSIY